MREVLLGALKSPWEQQASQEEEDYEIRGTYFGSCVTHRAGHPSFANWPKAKQDGRTDCDSMNKVPKSGVIF
jgi:hypothetical protein